jgi:streptogramin lyase
MKRLQLVLLVLAAGCSSENSDNTGNGSAASSPPMSLHGVVHGGQAPIVGATVTLYAASQQPLSPAVAVGTPVTTDSNGNFTFNSFVCPSAAAPMYVTSSGGNPGNGVNSAVHLMAILGPCGSLHQSVTLNELTTVAAAYTANRFIGPSGCADCVGGAPDAVDNISGNAIGVANAIGNAALLVSSVSGQAAPGLPTAADCAAATPAANCLTVRRLNTLGDALAACVNSTGPTSSQCVQLFNCATPGATYVNTTSCTAPAGAVPTDTLQAILSVARNPAKVSTNGLYQTCARNVVFSPVIINGVPPEFTLSLNFTGGGLNLQESLAVDSGGNVWIANYNDDNVVELGPNGAVLSGSGFAAGSGPNAIAFDASGNAWFSNYGNSLTVLNFAGAPILGSPITGGGLTSPWGIAVSSDGDVWAADFGSTTVSRFTAAGAPVGSGYTVGTGPLGVAIDAAGYVFVTNYSGNTVTQLSPDGTSVVNNLSGGGLSSPYGPAIDINGNLWVPNRVSGSGASLTKITLANEVQIGIANFTGGGLNGPSGVAIDAAGNVWAANTGNTVTELNSSGAALSPSTGFTVAGGDNFGNELTPAIDPSGNLWVSNEGNSSVSVIFGAAAPTRTPLVAAISQGFVP